MNLCASRFSAVADFHRYLPCLAAAVALSGAFTSTVTQQAIYFDLQLRASQNSSAIVQRSTLFNLYDGQQLLLGRSLLNLPKMSVAYTPQALEIS